MSNLPVRIIEAGVVYFGHVASRDPVSGTVYLAMLALFAAMPLVLGRSRSGSRV